MDAQVMQTHVESILNGENVATTTLALRDLIMTDNTELARLTTEHATLTGQVSDLTAANSTLLRMVPANFEAGKHGEAGKGKEDDGPPNYDEIIAKEYGGADDKGGNE